MPNYYWNMTQTPHLDVAGDLTVGGKESVAGALDVSGRSQLAGADLSASLTMRYGGDSAGVQLHRYYTNGYRLAWNLDGGDNQTDPSLYSGAFEAYSAASAWSETTGWWSAGKNTTGTMFAMDGSSTGTTGFNQPVSGGYIGNNALNHSFPTHTQVSIGASANYTPVSGPQWFIVGSTVFTITVAGITENLNYGTGFYLFDGTTYITNTSGSTKLPVFARMTY